MRPKTFEYRLIGAAALILLGVCVFGLATAATVAVSWVPPTTNTDTSAIPATGPGSLVTYRVEYGTCSAPGVFGVKAGEVPRPAPATGTTLNLQPGTSCVRVFVNNTYGNESIPSNVASRVVDAPTPGPPTNLTASAPQVFEVRPNESTFAFDRGRQVGTVKLGAACDESRSTGDDFFALERPSKVKLTKTPRSTALVAHCADS